MHRPNPARIRDGSDDPGLTGVAGLVRFGQFAREHGVDDALRQFDELKPGESVVYPMGDVLRMLLDAQVAGESRVFDVERLAADPLFRELCGGEVPGLDVLYRDLARFTDEALAQFEQVVSGEGLRRLHEMHPREVHLDLDTTVEPLFGEQQEDARPGPNPRYHGRPSYHPVVMRVAETGMVVGGWLRPGDTSFGAADAETLRGWLCRVREAVGPECTVRVRIDSAGDCTEILRVIEEEGVFFHIKAKLTPNLLAAVTRAQAWQTIDVDADRRPTAQTAEIAFAREDWKTLPVPVRVVALRAKERPGREVYLWDDLEFSVQAYLTCDPSMPAEDVVHCYDKRAGIEPMIGELKHGWGLGAVPSQSFAANQAMFLLKLYGHNLMRVYATDRHPTLARWSAAWLRRALIVIPGRIAHTARRVLLRLPPGVFAAPAPST